MSRRLLIIDDEKDFASFLAKRLRKENVEVFVANSAKEGAAIMKSAHPDLVLLDVILPDQSGVGFFDRLRAINCKTPIIMISGHGEIEIVVDFLKAGAADYVQKPIEFGDLWKKITQLLPANSATQAQ